FFQTFVHLCRTLNQHTTRTPTHVALCSHTQARSRGQNPTRFPLHTHASTPGAKKQCKLPPAVNKKTQTERQQQKKHNFLLYRTRPHLRTLSFGRGWGCYCIPISGHATNGRHIGF
ncbi:unnamed protein product, partial [Ectocarpus sp. 4 AP-2014]